MRKYHLLLSIIILEGVTAITKEPLDQQHKITNDFAYETTPNKKRRILNPSYALVVKNISLEEVMYSIETMESLLENYNRTCNYVIRQEGELALNPEFEQITGSFNISGAMKRCRTRFWTDGGSQRRGVNRG